MALLKRLLHNRRGTSAIEFALVAPVLIFMIIGVADVARALAHKYVIEQALYRTVELVTVGSLQSEYSYVVPEVEAALAESLGTEEEAEVELLSWLECNNVKYTGAGSETSTCPNTNDEAARFVQVDIESYFDPTFSYGPLGEAFTGNEGGRVRLTAHSVLRVK